ncbi:MAG: hypothetical protein RL699_677 [Bacteroidota bacterium]
MWLFYYFRDMKFLASIFLFLFLSALSYPTMLVLVKKIDDKTFALSLEEEEHEHEQELTYKEIKFQSSFYELIVQTKHYVSYGQESFLDYQLLHDSISLPIIVPPPKFI